MKVCPNPGCPYAVKFRRAQEYRDDVVACADCGTTLTAEAPASAAPPGPRVASGNEALQRLLVTLGAGALLWVGLRQPLFSFSGSVVAGGHGLDALPELTLLQLGAAPFVAAFALVELVALLVPALRKRRVGSAADRAPLLWAALALGVLAMGGRIFGLMQWARSADLAGLLPAPGVVGVQLAVAAAAMLGLIFASTRWGLLNGFALIALVDVGNLLLQQLARLVGAFAQEQLTPAALLVLTGTLGAGVALAVWRAGRSRPTTGGPEQLAPPAPVSGLDPWLTGASVAMLPSTIASLVGGRGDALGLERSSTLGTGLTAFFALDAALLLGFLFFRPKAVGALWARWVKGVDEAGVVLAARALLPKVLGEAVALTVAVPLFLALVAGALNLPSSAWLLVQAMAGGLVVLDAAAEWRARRRLGPLVSVRPLHRMAELQPLMHLLAREGIEVFPRSASYRAALQFFGPHVPVELLVPAAQADAARRLLDGR